MKTRSRLAAVLLVTLLIAGCVSSAGTSLDGKSVEGKSVFLGRAVLTSTDKEVTLTLHHKTVKVTATQISWASGTAIELPATWHKLVLTEWFGSITINVDGHTIATIRTGE